MKEPVVDWRDIMSWRQEVAALYRPVCEAVELSAVWMAFVTARRELIHTHAGAMSVADKTGPHYFANGDPYMSNFHDYRYKYTKYSINYE